MLNIDHSFGLIAGFELKPKGGRGVELLSWSSKYFITFSNR